MPVQIGTPAGPESLREVAALVDTGASRTVITPYRAEQIGLRQLNEETLYRAGGLERVPTYAAIIRFPFGTSQFDLFEVMGCSLPGQPVECLIGRDVLARWMFTYDGRTGSWQIEEEDSPLPITPPDL